MPELVVHLLEKIKIDEDDAERAFFQLVFLDELRKFFVELPAHIETRERVLERPLIILAVQNRVPELLGETRKKINIVLRENFEKTVSDQQKIPQSFFAHD